MRILSAALFVLLLVAPGFAQYDRHFVEYTTLHFGTLVSPKWIKATAMAESNLKWNARSGVGAAGLMQVMPATWADVAPEPWKTLGPLDPQAAIYVGTRYMRQIWNRWSQAERYQRQALTNAGYNSGPGWVLRAQAACRMDYGCNPNVWDAPHLEAHLRTSPQSQAETRGYVRRIRAFELRVQIGM